MIGVIGMIRIASTFANASDGCGAAIAAAAGAPAAMSDLRPLPLLPEGAPPDLRSDGADVKSLDFALCLCDCASGGSVALEAGSDARVGPRG